MPRLWLGNFDFEHRLADPQHMASRRLLRLNAELAACWLALADDGDAVWTPAPIPHEFWEAMAARGLPRVTAVADCRAAVERDELMPWGWTPVLLAIAARADPGRSLPTAEAVRRANSRRWSFALEQNWRVGPPLSAACESVEKVAAAIANSTSSDWVIKAEFGMSGRERIRGRGPLSPPAIGWLQKRLKADRIVFFEPWLERVAEAGVLFDIPVSGEPILRGVAEMLPSSSGQYAGSVFTGRLTDIDWSPAVEIATRAADELQRLGYHGPLGIDVMAYRTHDGEIKLRPLQDINARWTMGRLALGWRRHFPEVTLGVWSHTAAIPGPLSPVFGREGRGEETSALPTTAPRFIPTSPDTVGGEPTQHRTALIVQP